MTKSTLIVLSLVWALSCQGLAGTAGASTAYYVDTAGIGGRAGDHNPGTMKKPWKTISRAFEKGSEAGPGDTVYIGREPS